VKIDSCQLGIFAIFSLLRWGTLTAICHVTVSTAVDSVSLNYREGARVSLLQLCFVIFCPAIRIIACPCVFPCLQESLAFMFEMANLREDALREYDELEQIYSETGKYCIMNT
jgi:hypothetical protein